MSRSRRALVSVPAVAILAWLGFLAASAEGADAASADGLPGLEKAVRREPSDPSLHEQIGLALARNIDSPERAQAAIMHMDRALELRPVSPYAWAALAEVRYRAGVADEMFQAALVRAASLGPNEPEVQEIVAFYGLALRDQLHPEARAAVDSMMLRGLKRAPETMLRIAERRGRLGAACSLLDASQRIADNSIKLCRSTGATQ